MDLWLIIVSVVLFVKLAVERGFDVTWLSRWVVAGGGLLLWSLRDVD